MVTMYKSSKFSVLSTVSPLTLEKSCQEFFFYLQSTDKATLVQREISLNSTSKVSKNRSHNITEVDMLVEVDKESEQGG